MFVTQTVMYRGHHKIDKYRAAPSRLLRFTMQVCPKGMTKGRVCTSRTRRCTISKPVTMDRSRILRGNERRRVFPCTRRPLASTIPDFFLWDSPYTGIAHTHTHTHTIQMLMRAVRDGITIKNRAILRRVFDGDGGQTPDVTKSNTVSSYYRP